MSVRNKGGIYTGNSQVLHFIHLSVALIRLKIVSQNYLAHKSNKVCMRNPTKTVKRVKIKNYR